MKPISNDEYDIGAMHERACKAIYALQRSQREISALMGVDTSIPLHERRPLLPTMSNIGRAARILGVSVKWLMTGIPETHTDLLVIGQGPKVTGSAIITGSEQCTIVVKNTAGA